MSDTPMRNWFNYVNKFPERFLNARLKGGWLILCRTPKRREKSGGIVSFASFRVLPNRWCLNLFDHTPINVEVFAEIKLHSLDEHIGLNLLAARNNVLERHAGTDLK